MKRTTQLIIGIVVALAAVGYTVRNVAMDELLVSFGTVEWYYMAATFSLMVATYAARAVRWKTLVDPIKPVRTLDLVSPMMIGFLAGVLPARAGEFIRAYLLGKSQNLSIASAFATIVVERLFDLVTLLGMLAWVLVFHAEVFESAASWSGISVRDLALNFGWLSVMLVLGLVVFIYLLVFKKELALRLVHFFVRPLPDRWGLVIVEMVDTFEQGLNVVRHPSALLKIGAATAAVWFFIVAAYYPLYWAYDFQDKSVASLVLMTLMVCILITVLPTPAFLGSFNAGVLIALHEIMKESEVAVVSFGFVAWGLNFILIVVAGLYFTLHDHVNVTEIAEMDRS